MIEDGSLSPIPTLKRKKAIVFSSDEEEEVTKLASPQKKVAVSMKATAVPKAIPKAKVSTSHRSSTAAKKRMDALSCEEDEDGDLPQGKAKSKAAPKRAPPKKVAPKDSAATKMPAEKTIGRVSAKDDPMDIDEGKPKTKFK